MKEILWDSIYLGSPYAKYPGDVFVYFMEESFQYTNTNCLSLMEVGCGPGSHLLYAQSKGFEVFGIDGSNTAVQLCRERLTNQNRLWRGEIVVGDFVKLTWEDEVFDVVVDNEAIYCNSYEDSKEAYKEMYRVCRPGGKFFSRTFAVGSYGDGLGEKVGHNAWLCSEGPLKGKGYSRFTEFDEIKDLVGDFKITRIELLKRTVQNMKYEIKEWVIFGEK